MIQNYSMRMSLNIKNNKKENKLQNYSDIVETSNIIHLLFITVVFDIMYLCFSIEMAS